MDSSLKSWLGTGTINIFGRPFAGKDTQAAKLAALFDAPVLGGGDILRNSTIPPHVDTALKQGNLIPSQDYVDIVLPYLSKQEFVGSPLILSSVGRWIGEEVGVIAALEKAQHSLKTVIYLEISEDAVRQRWENLTHNNDRGDRYDDTAEILENRLKEYREKTLPVIAEYEKLGLLVKIDGTGSPDEVHESILAELKRLTN